MVVVLKNCDVHPAGLHAFVVTVLCSAVHSSHRRYVKVLLENSVQKMENKKN